MQKKLKTKQNNTGLSIQKTVKNYFQSKFKQYYAKRTNTYIVTSTLELNADSILEIM